MATELEIRTVDCDRTPIWTCLLAQPDPHPILSNAVAAMLRPGSGAAGVVQGSWCHMVDRRGGLMLSALLHRPTGGGPIEVRAMYPYSESGYLWPMTLQLIERSSDGGTGTVLGKAGAAALGVFDTMHFRGSYRPDTTYPFQVSGIAVAMRRESLPDRYAADFCGFGNLRMLTRDAEQPGDVVEVHSIVQAVQPASFLGAKLTRYLLTLAKGPGFDLTFDVYGNDEVVGRFDVGDRITGHVWIFGFHPQ
jgi:hypothetical protein